MAMKMTDESENRVEVEDKMKTIDIWSVEEFGRFKIVSCME
jgi:hypothetical protein